LADIWLPPLIKKTVFGPRIDVDAIVDIWRAFEENLSKLLFTSRHSFSVHSVTQGVLDGHTSLCVSIRISGWAVRFKKPTGRDLTWIKENKFSSDFISELLTFCTTRRIYGSVFKLFPIDCRDAGQIKINALSVAETEAMIIRTLNEMRLPNDFSELFATQSRFPKAPRNVADERARQKELTKSENNVFCKYSSTIARRIEFFNKWKALKEDSFPQVVYNSLNVDPNSKTLFHWRLSPETIRQSIVFQYPYWQRLTGALIQESNTVNEVCCQLDCLQLDNMRHPEEYYYKVIDFCTCLEFKSEGSMILKEIWIDGRTMYFASEYFPLGNMPHLLFVLDGQSKKVGNRANITLSVAKTWTIELLHSLNELHKECRAVWGVVRPEQIYITSTGHATLGLPSPIDNFKFIEDTTPPLRKVECHRFIDDIRTCRDASKADALKYPSPRATLNSTMEWLKMRDIWTVGLIMFQLSCYSVGFCDYFDVLVTIQDGQYQDRLPSIPGLCPEAVLFFAKIFKRGSVIGSRELLNEPWLDNHNTPAKERCILTESFRRLLQHRVASGIATDDKS